MDFSVSDVNSKIIHNIGRLARAKGISQAALAREVETEPSQFNRYMTLKRPIPMTLASDVADALGVGFEELLSTPPAADAPPREPTELEMVAWLVSRAEIHPERKPALLGLLKDYLEEERLALVMAVLSAGKADISTMTENLADFLPAKGDDARKRGAR